MPTPPRPPHVQVVSRALPWALVAWFALVAAPALAEPPRALAGVSACALLEDLPGPGDPIRVAPVVARAFAALDRARGDAKRSLASLARFDAALDPLFREARSIFHPPPDAALDRGRAQRLLARHVFARDAVLRVGRDGFEARVAIAAAMALAACRGGDVDRAVGIGRGATGPEAASLRAFAALLLLDAGRRSEAAELAPSLGDEGFLAPWVLAELAPAGDERRALQARAARRVATPDQQTALAEQARRLMTPR